VHDERLLLLLLLAAALVILVQTWRLAHQREIAHANEAASHRESDRQAAAQARSLRASEGEQGAVALLERAGYAVLEHQVLGSWTVRADGEPLTFGLRADYLVAKDGRRYIAEVKTGRIAPRLSHGPTRRQLLEYTAAFDVDGVILVDADGETLTHVDLDRALAGQADAPRVGVGGIPARIVAIVALISFSLGLLVGTSIVK
jgi:hypothetical protein